MDSGGLVPRVFLSFSYQNKTVVSFATQTIKPALERAGLEVLVVGGEGITVDYDWTPTIMDAAAHSAVLVAVVDSTYPERPWCMRELDVALHGVDSKAARPRVIPLFYKTDPEVVKGSLPSSWGSKNAPSKEELDRWPKNLSDLADLAKQQRAAQLPGGIEDDTEHAKLQQLQATRQLVGLAVAAMYPQTATPFLYAEQVATLAGEAAVPLESRRDWSGIWLQGEEHSGKRTLARHLFALLSGYRRHAASSPSDRFPKFAKSVFVNLASGDSDSDSQEQHWLRSVLKQLGDLDAHAKLDTTTLQQRYKNAVQGHAVLLVLTNLTTPKQFGTLSAGLGSGSCVVVTSGSGLDQVLQMTDSRRSLITEYTVQKVLSQDSSSAGGSGSLPQHLQLILPPRVPARLQPAVPEEGAVADQQQEHAAKESSSIITEFVCSSIKELEAIPILGLRALTMFFDIVGVLDGEEYAAALAVWSGMAPPDPAPEGFSNEAAFAELTQRGLVSVDALGRLVADDAASEEGRSILCGQHAKQKEFNCEVGSWLWLEDNGKLPARLDEALKEINNKVIVRAAKVDIPTLRRLLSLKHLFEPQILFITPSSSGDNKLHLPAESHLHELLWLDLACGVRDLRPWLQHAPNLVVLRATEATRSSKLAWLTARLPGLMRRGPQHGMKELPNSIKDLSKLQVLDLHDCTHLEALPATITELATAMRELRLRGCSSLKALPQSIGVMSSLRVLDLRGCSSLSRLPTGLGRLQALEELDLRECKELKSVPETVWRLSRLIRFLPPDNLQPLIPPPVFQLRPQRKDRWFTVLSIDGGGMRGLIPARVLETVEKVLKEEATKRIDSADPEFKRCFGNIPSKGTFNKELDDDYIKVDLADFFHVISGTSTGSILAAYLASKGGYTDDNILDADEYDAGLHEFNDYTEQQQQQQQAQQQAQQQQQQQPTSKPKPGSARAAQAMFVATGHVIFPKKAWVRRSVSGVSSTLLSAVGGIGGLVRSIPIVGFVGYALQGSAAFLQMLPSGLFCKHDSNGIVKVLQQSFGHGHTAVRFSTCAQSPQHTAGQPALYTSLLVPTFHVEKNQAVLFWHNSYAGGSEHPPHAWGFTTINRLRPPRWLTDLSIEPLPYGGKRRRVNVACSSGASAQGSLVFDSIGDTLHVFAGPPLQKGAPAEAVGSSNPAPPQAEAVTGDSSSSSSSSSKVPEKPQEAIDAVPSNSSTDQGGSRSPHPDKAAEAAATAATNSGNSSTSSTNQRAPVALVSKDGRAEVLDFALWEVVRASTAAPTFFPAHKMAVADLAPDHGTDAGMPGAVLKPAAGQRPWPLLSGHFVDGGVVANNPTIAAMSFLQRIQNESQVTNTAVLSLGCGTCWDKSGLPIARGELFVASPLINIMMGANCDTAVAAGEMLFRTAQHNLARANSGMGGAGSQQSVSSFLRIQAVAFLSDDSGQDAPPQHQQQQQQEPTQGQIQPPPPQQQQQHWGNYYEISPHEDAKVKAMQRMDVPDDWRTLLDIGTGLAEARETKERLREWVSEYLLGSPPPAAMGSGRVAQAPVQTADSSAVAVRVVTRPTALIDAWQKQPQQQQQQGGEAECAGTTGS